MMNENNEVFTMEDEPVATAIQNMLKGSKWLSAFWKVTVRHWTGNIT